VKKRRSLLKSIAGGLTVGTLLQMEVREDTSINEFIGKQTARFIINPRKYLKPNATENIDIEEFGNDFVHRTDPMNGLYDTVQDVDRTIESKKGDCVDYSAVAASWILQHKNTNPKLLIYIPKSVGYGHMNVSDGSTLYNNGQVIRDYGSISEIMPEFELVYERKI
jgi:hypothetical protein